jgi:hypothetical protein
VKAVSCSASLESLRQVPKQNKNSASLASLSTLLACADQQTAWDNPAIHDALGMGIPSTL